jgi:hypothetical protein
MRKLTFAIALMFLVAAAWLSMRNNLSHAADAKPVVQKLEYLQHTWIELNEQPNGGHSLLEDLGNQGWEMCGVIPVSGSNAYVILKRPKQ